MIQSADTDFDENFRKYESDHVFIIKEDPDDDHWLAGLPREVIASVKAE